MRSPIPAVVLACFVALSVPGCGGKDVGECLQHKGFNVVGNFQDWEASSAGNQVEVRTGMSKTKAAYYTHVLRSGDFAVVDQIGGNVLAWERKPTPALRRRVESCLS
jgi:hypothetical protein